MGFSLKDLNPRWARWPNPPAVYEIWDDFDGETTISTTDTDASPWAGDAVASGTGVMTVDASGGVVRFANNGTDDNSGFQIQRDMETVVLQASKDLRFTAKFKASDVDASSFFLGLAITDTSIQHATVDTLAGGLTITDGIGFYSPDATGSVYGVVIRDSVQLATGPVATLTDGAYTVLSFDVQMTSTAGEGTVIFYADGVEVGRIRSTALPYSAEEVLAPSAAWKSTAASAQTADLDYIGVLAER